VVAILPGDGSGRFGAATTVAAGYGQSSLAVADVNIDGNADLAVGSMYSDRGRSQYKLTIMLGNGTGGFRRAAGSPLAVPGMPLSLAVADLNADGKPDIAVATNYGAVDSITILMGNGAGTFRPAVDSPFPVPSAAEVAAADLNGDGRPDLAVAGTEGVRIVFRTPALPPIARGRNLRGRPNPTFTTSGLITKLAADGPRVAVKTTARGSCGRVVVWTAPGRTSKNHSDEESGLRLDRLHPRHGLRRRAGARRRAGRMDRPRRRKQPRAQGDRRQALRRRREGARVGGQRLRRGRRPRGLLGRSPPRGWVSAGLQRLAARLRAPRDLRLRVSGSGASPSGSCASRRAGGSS
jgi:hypothetical protein